MCEFNCLTFAEVELCGKYASMQELANTAWALTTAKPSSKSVPHGSVRVDSMGFRNGKAGWQHLICNLQSAPCHTAAVLEKNRQRGMGTCDGNPDGEGATSTHGHQQRCSRVASVPEKSHLVSGNLRWHYVHISPTVPASEQECP